MAPGERKSTEPRRHWPQLAGTGREGRPGRVLASQVLGFTLPRTDCTEKVPQRRKAPDFSNSDVQRATLAIHSLGLICGFFPVFCLFVFSFSSVFVPSAPMKMPPLPLALELWAKEPHIQAQVQPPGSGVPQPGHVLRSPAPGETPAYSVAAEPIPPEARSRAETHRPGTAHLLSGSHCCEKELL